MILSSPFKITSYIGTIDTAGLGRPFGILASPVFLTSCESEVDPLICPKCNSPMKVIAIIMDEDVKEKILDHLGLWEDDENDSRAPPVITENNMDLYEEVQHIPFDACPELSRRDGWAVNESAVKYAA